MRIIVSFDTEDFTDPATNDVLLEICRTLTRRGVRACFGLVGEKARFLRDLGREDVVAALAAHEICYHSDNHFLFPDEGHEKRFASRIVEECSWDEGVNWLVSTEGRGLADIEALFGYRPTTHLRTCGDSAAQLLAAFGRLGLKTYAYGLSINERTRHIARYANMLCVSLPLISEELVYAGKGIERFEELAADGAELVNLRFHPCRFLCDEWWDGPHNYMEVENPRTRPPFAPTPHVPPEETAQRLANLGALIDHVQERGDVEFTTYGAVSDAVAKEPPFLSREKVERAAREMGERLSFVETGDFRMSLAEVFAAVVWALLNPQAQWIPFRHPLGPTRLPGEVDADETVTAGAVLEACAAIEDGLAVRDRVPDRVEGGGQRAAPGPFLRAAAEVLLGESSAVLEEGPIYPEGFDDVLSRWDEISHDLVAYFPQRGRPVPNTKLGIKLQYWSYKPVGI